VRCRTRTRRPRLLNRRVYGSAHRAHDAQEAALRRRDGEHLVIEISNLRRLVGKNVLAPGGDVIGKVTAVYESTAGDGPTFATVATGLFGKSSSFVPLERADLRSDEVYVPYSREVVKGAPRIDVDAELTTEDEDRLFAYYEGVDRGPEASLTPPSPGTDGAMTRSEERLQVTTERVETGRARLRKYVVTETVVQTVPVSHEELRVVREPIAPGEAPAVSSLSEEEHEIVLSAERPVVQKEVVAVERVRLATDVVAGEETVTEQVRKEQVELLDDLPARAAAPDEETHTTTEWSVEPGRVDPPDEGTTTELTFEPRR
jgi:uncharacterized protein (TIGR02271 family)